MSEACKSAHTCACMPCRKATRAVDRARLPGAKWWQRIAGGTARNPRSFDREQLILGTMHELEHAKDPKVAMEIAMDHIAEDRRAYLDAMPNGPRGAKKKAGKRVHDWKACPETDDEITVLESLEAALVDSGDPEATRTFFDSDGAKWDEAHAEVARGYAYVKRQTKHAIEIGLTERGAIAVMRSSTRNGPRRDRRWIADAIKRPGKLGGPGFLSRPPDEQLRILDRCRDEYGTRSCLGSVMLLERLAPARHRARLAVLHDYLKDSHRRGHTPTPNPDDGGWDAIPIIIVPIDLRGASLTRAQVIELSELTL